MTDRTFLPDLEHVVLAAVLRLERPYGAQLLREIAVRTGREVPTGSLYVTLDRLVAKGLLTSSLGDRDAGRGGRPRRYLEVTALGLRALAETRRAFLSIWGGLEDRLEGV